MNKYICDNSKCGNKYCTHRIAHDFENTCVIAYCYSPNNIVRCINIKENRKLKLKKIENNNARR